jgi:hypothetical protein
MAGMWGQRDVHQFFLSAQWREEAGVRPVRSPNFSSDRGCSDLPNSVIPTEAEYRKTMICGAEGPAVVTSPGCEGRLKFKSEDENTNQRQENAVQQ